MGIFDKIPTQKEIDEFEESLKDYSSLTTAELLTLIDEGTKVQEHAYDILVHVSRKLALYHHLARIKELQRTIRFV